MRSIEKSLSLFLSGRKSLGWSVRQEGVISPLHLYNCPRSPQQMFSQVFLAQNMPYARIYTHHQQRVWKPMIDLDLSGFSPWAGAQMNTP